jgi:thymidylate synthase
MARQHRNVSFAAAESFSAVLAHGAEVNVRGSLTRELRNRVTSIERPYERCVFLPGRRHDIFAQIAETLWVIAGRNDLPWLERYLPRAPDFSDDGGKSWRAAYGPRLRAWAGVDQLNEWRRLLRDDPMSRRVVGVIFDPSRDFVESRDIPCNNWLSWLIRDNNLHLNVAIRSNDAMWGFSGVNAFEWSVLQEMMAFWLGVEIGETTFFATSYHLYERHYDTARNVVQNFYGITPYDYAVPSARFATHWDDFEATLADWFAVESKVANDPDAPLDDRLAMRDPMLGSMIRLLRLKWGALGWTDDRLAAELAALPQNDFAAAAYEHFGRKKPALIERISQSGIANFFAACQSAKTVSGEGLKDALKHLHARKNRSYAGSWKRRGERVSILPNIARKVDRLRAFADDGLDLDGETILDTALDLFVYAQKYRLFLAELGAETALSLPPDAPLPYSDHDVNFDALVDRARFDDQKLLNFEAHVAALTALFEEMWQGVDEGGSLGARSRWAADLAGMADILIGHIAAKDKPVVAEFIRHELGTS